MTPFPPPTGPPSVYPLDNDTYDRLEYVHPDSRHPEHVVPLFEWVDANGDVYWWQY